MLSGRLLDLLAQRALDRPVRRRLHTVDHHDRGGAEVLLRGLGLDDVLEPRDVGALGDVVGDVQRWPPR